MNRWLSGTTGVGVAGVLALLVSVGVTLGIASRHSDDAPQTPTVERERGPVENDTGTAFKSDATDPPRDYSRRRGSGDYDDFYGRYYEDDDDDGYTPYYGSEEEEDDDEPYVPPPREGYNPGTAGEPGEPGIPEDDDEGEDGDSDGVGGEGGPGGGPGAAE